MTGWRFVIWLGRDGSLSRPTDPDSTVLAEGVVPDGDEDYAHAFAIDIMRRYCGVSTDTHSLCYVIRLDRRTR